MLATNGLASRLHETLIRPKRSVVASIASTASRPIVWTLHEVLWFLLSGLGETGNVACGGRMLWSLSGCELMLLTLLTLLPILVGLLALGWCLALPAAIRRGFWIRPRFDMLPLNEAIEELNRPELAAAEARFDELSEQLRGLGFRETERQVAINVTSQRTLVILLALDRATDTMAAVQLVWSGEMSDRQLQLRGEYLGFETQYQSLRRDPLTGREGPVTLTVQTTTSPQVFPAPATHHLLCVDWIESLEEVHRLHRLHCERCRPSEGQLTADAVDLPERLTRRHARVMAAAVRDGYLQPIRPGLLQLTHRGAWHLTTRIVWPLAPGIAARERRQTRRMLQAWGA